MSLESILEKLRGTHFGTKNHLERMVLCDEIEKLFKEQKQEH